MRAVLATAALAALAVGCTTTSGSSGGGGAASCANRVKFDDQTYRDLVNIKFTVGDKVGTATTLACDDTGGNSESDSADAVKSTAYKIDGLDTRDAIAVGDSPDDLTFFVDDSGDPPAAVQKLIDAS